MLEARAGLRLCFMFCALGPPCLARTLVAFERMFIVRLCLAAAALGAAAFFGYEAYWTLAVACAFPGIGGNSLRLLGVTLSFPVGLAVLVVLALVSALFAAYVLFLHRSDN